MYLLSIHCLLTGGKWCICAKAHVLFAGAEWGVDTKMASTVPIQGLGFGVRTALGLLRASCSDPLPHALSEPVSLQGL